MKIVIFANASYNIGTGHVMRSLALADFFVKKGCHITFMTDATLPGNICSFMNDKGYAVIVPGVENILPLTDLMIIDNYSINESFEREARKYAKIIMIIDDLANRKHDCDILLDQNYNDSNDRYRELVPPRCRLLLGSKYVILRDEFLEEKKTLRRRGDTLRKILINFGGADHVDMTSKVLDILKSYDIQVDVVMGKSAVFLSKVEQICNENKNFTLHVNASNMAKLIASADLAIAAGGTSTWERTFLGLPSIVIAIADNQIEIAEKMAAKNLLLYAGFYTDNKIEDKISGLLSACIKNADMLKKQSEKLMILLDGKGKERIWEACLQKNN